MPPTGLIDHYVWRRSLLLAVFAVVLAKALQESLKLVWKRYLQKHAIQARDSVMDRLRLRILMRKTGKQ